MKTSIRKASVAAALALVGTLGVPFATPAHADVLACGTTVTKSVTLSADIGPCAGDGLVVNANKVTVDLNGFTISGNGNYEDTPQAGIRVAGKSNVVVTDTSLARTGTIKLFNAGVLIDGGSANTVSNITTADNRACNTNDFTATGFAPDPCNASNMGDGILINGSDRNTVSGNTVTGNGNFNVASGGITMTNFSTRNVVSGNTVKKNRNTGLRVEAPNSVRNKITDNTSNENGSCGKFFGRTFCGGNGLSLSFGAAQSEVLNNTFANNIGSGAFTSFDSDRSTLSGNTATGNGGTGIGLGGGYITVSNNTVTLNRGHGITVPGGSVFASEEGPEGFIRRHNVVQANTVTGNGLNGIFVLCPKDFVSDDPAKRGKCLTEVYQEASTGMPIPTSTQDEILNNTSTGNGTRTGGLWDLRDEHPTCDKNVWDGNTYRTATPACTTTNGTQL